MTLFTSLSACMMCTGTIIHFGIPRVVVGEAQTFPIRSSRTSSP